MPAQGRGVANVRQNLRLLVANGQPAPDIDVIGDWGATIQGAVVVARCALGIDAQGDLSWAGSMAATRRALAGALIAAGSRQALQRDIDPIWVCAFFHARQPDSCPARAERPIGTYLTAWQRDFFTVVSK